MTQLCSVPHAPTGLRGPPAGAWANPSERHSLAPSSAAGRREKPPPGPAAPSPARPHPRPERRRPLTAAERRGAPVSWRIARSSSARLGAAQRRAERPAAITAPRGGGALRAARHGTARHGTAPRLRSQPVPLAPSSEGDGTGSRRQHRGLGPAARSRSGSPPGHSSAAHRSAPSPSPGGDVTSPCRLPAAARP